MRAGNLAGIWQKSISLARHIRHCECMEMKRGFLLTALLVNMLLTAPAHATITLKVDATAAPRNLLHAELHIPASPGPLTLVYPKWIPGEHSPSGPINGVTGLKFSAHGQPLEWQRDAEDMFQFHLNVPPGVKAVDVAFDFLLGTGGGYYDRALAGLARLPPGRRPRLVGISYACNEVPMLAAAPHDIPLDHVVTELELIDCHHRRARP